MNLIPYRSTLDFAQEINRSHDRRQLEWDEIDYELGGSLVERLRSLAQRAAAHVPAIHLAPRRERRPQRERLESIV